MESKRKLLEEFIISHSKDAARIIEQLKTEQITALIKNLPIDLSVLLLREMEYLSVHTCLEELEVDQSAKIIERLPSDNTSAILRRMNKDIRERILERVDPKISRSLAHKLDYAENTAGALMELHVPTIPEDFSVKGTLDRIKKNKKQSYQYIYVVNDDRKLLGIVKLENLITANSKEQITAIINSNVPHLLAETNIQKILKHPGWIEYNALPVLDRSGVFLGTISQGVIRQTEIKKRQVSKHAIQASNALGELYRIGLTALLSSTTGQNESAE